jgi:HAD superfamily hydrolase (TIGR01484 family)
MNSHSQNFKAIFCDMDGTLIPGRFDALPSERVVLAVKKAMEKGVHVAVATARPYRYTEHLFKIFGLKGPSVMSGGAEIIEADTGKILTQHILPKSSIADISKILEKFKVEYHIQDSGKDFKYSAEYRPEKPLVIVAYEFDSATADAIIADLKNIPHLSLFKVPTYHGKLVSLHITHEKASKGAAIKEIMLMLGLKKEEVIGIGDGYNDIPLLNAAGLKIAMGNSVPELLEIADEVTATVDDDGVAKAIEKYILVD